MNLTQILKTKNLNGVAPIEAIEKYCKKELDITLQNFKDNKEVGKLKANFRRIVDLILERAELSSYDLLDVFNPDFLDFIKYKCVYETDNGELKALMSENLKWVELQIVVMTDDADNKDTIIKKRKSLRNTMKLKDFFLGEIVG